MIVELLLLFLSWIVLFNEVYRFVDQGRDRGMHADNTVPVQLLFQSQLSLHVAAVAEFAAVAAVAAVAAIAPIAAVAALPPQDMTNA